MGKEHLVEIIVLVIFKIFIKNKKFYFFTYSNTLLETTFPVYHVEFTICKFPYKCCQKHLAI